VRSGSPFEFRNAEPPTTKYQYTLSFKPELRTPQGDVASKRVHLLFQFD